MAISKRIACILTWALLMGQGMGPVQAQADPVFTYQGQLKEAGRPYDGTAYLEFTLWDALENGNQLGGPYWTSDSVNVENGLFTVEVDAMAFGPLAFNGEPRWLQIVVTDWQYTILAELTPRQPITPAPYALYAFDGAGGEGGVSLPYQGSVTFDGDAFKITNHGMAYATGGSFESTGDGGIGVYGKGGVDGYGGVFEGDADAIAGVKGSTTRDNGAGVYGSATSPNGWGVYASNSAISGTAYGVFGRTQSTDGTAMWGEARGTSGTATGVHGQTRSPDGKGISGWNSASTGDAIAIYGATNSSDGYAGYFEGPKNYFSGNVGIGTPFPESPLTVDGMIESKAGGFKFPDGTIQTSAGGGGGTTLWQAWESHIYSPTANVSIGDGEPSDYVTLRVESGPDEYPLSVTASYEAAPWAVYAKSTTPYGVGLYAVTNDLGPTWAVYGETSGSNGWGGYFIGKGYFSGHVGIGTTAPGSPLTVDGLIESTASGFKFPDGSIQNTAATGGGSSLWTADTTGINYQSGHVGIGSSSTTTDSLHVHGSSTRAILGINDAPTGMVNGVEGSADSTSGRGVYGHASATSGQAVGVLGETASPDGYGVWGYNDDDSLTGKSVGVYGSSNGTRGVGVKGHVFGDGGAALWGRHDGTAGTGILVEVGAPSGNTYGVNAYVASPTGFGVHAFNEGESGNAIAIYGETGSPTGIAGYFDGRGYFSDNVGIGTTTPGSKLTVAGMIESTSLGFKFPDGSVQATAATGGGSSLWQTNGSEIYYNTGNVGVGVTDPHSPLHIAGGNWDVGNTEGDFKIGSATYRLKIGVATGGGGAGHCRIFAGGPSSELILGVSGQDRLAVTDTKVDITGNLEVDGFKLTTAPAAGFVLTSDASGNGTWQSPTGGSGSFDLPYAGSVAHTGDAFKVTNTGTFMGSAISGIIQNASSSDASAGSFSAEGSGMAIHAESDGGRTIYARNSGAGPAIYASTAGGPGGEFTCTGASCDGIEAEGTGTGIHATSTGNAGVAVRAEAVGAESNAVYATSSWNALVASGGLHAAKFYGKVVVYPSGGGGKTFSVENDGTTQVNVLQIMGGADLSEQFDVADADGEAQPGMVVCIDPNSPGKLVVSDKAYDRTVAGIISGAGGIKTGMMMGQRETVADGAHPVALTGRVYVLADASSNPIEPGDLLTTSNVPGHAMKVTDYDKAHGATLGKAMTSLDSGRGLVLVLVSLQ